MANFSGVMLIMAACGNPLKKLFQHQFIISGKIKEKIQVDKGKIISIHKLVRKAQVKPYYWRCRYLSEGCESSDFNLISDFFALHKTPFSDF